MQFYGIIFKGKELHSSELEKYYCIHILGFGLPVHPQHWAEIMHFLLCQLQLIRNAVPSLQKRRSNMIPCYFVAVSNLQYFWWLAVIHIWRFISIPALCFLGIGVIHPFSAFRPCRMLIFDLFLFLNFRSILILSWNLHFGSSSSHAHFDWY